MEAKRESRSVVHNELPLEMSVAHRNKRQGVRLQPTESQVHWGILSLSECIIMRGRKCHTTLMEEVRLLHVLSKKHLK